MFFNSYLRPRTLLIGAAVLVAGAGAWLALSGGNAGAAGAPAAPPATTAHAAVTTAVTSDTNLYPFGVPTGNGDFTVPPPPEEPTLVPTIGRRRRSLYGANPFEEAVSITQHIWPAAVAENGPTRTTTIRPPWP